VSYPLILLISFWASIKNFVGDSIKYFIHSREMRKPWKDSENTLLAISAHAPHSPSKTEV
jgi:hypothetical protein